MHNILRSFICLFMVAILIITVISCGNNEGVEPVEIYNYASESPIQESAKPNDSTKPSTIPQPEEIEIVSKLPLNLSEINAIAESTIDVDITYEAEDAALSGGTKAESSQSGYTGSGYVTNFTSPDTDKVTFHITIPENSYYNLTFISAAPYGDKINNILIDSNFIGELPSKGKNFQPYTIEKVYMDKGDHEIAISHSWGWFLLDSLNIKASEPFDTSIFTVPSKLINKNADDNTKRLMKFLSDVYGKYIISGQYSENGMYSNEFTAIRTETGRYPAMAGLDLIDYTPSRVLRGTSSKAVDSAIQWWEKGGLVTFAWHWNAPTKYLPDTNENPWWSGFYSRATNIDLEKIMNGEDEEGYNLLLEDIDAIAEQLKKLQDAKVPILWRPLHEASGGWFWWGNKGPEPYIALWKLLYDRLTNEHQLNNLIWVWNAQAAEWYPGDQYVDIIGEDIYPGEKQYGSQYGKFSQALKYTETKKIIALTENGCLFDPDLAFKDNARWAWFATWSGDFVINKNNGNLSEQYTEKSMLKKVYEHERVLSLIDIPDIKTYHLD